MIFITSHSCHSRECGNPVQNKETLDFSIRGNDKRESVGLLLFLVYMFPTMAYAAPSLGNFKDLVNFLIILFNQAIAVLLGLGVVYLLYGIVKTIMHGDNEQIRSDGRQMMLYGVVALFVIVSMWGLINVLVGTFFGGSVPRL